MLNGLGLVGPLEVEDGLDVMPVAETRLVAVDAGAGRVAPGGALIGVPAEVFVALVALAALEAVGRVRLLEPTGRVGTNLLGDLAVAALAVRAR